MLQAQCSKPCGSDTHSCPPVPLPLCRWTRSRTSWWVLGSRLMPASAPLHCATKGMAQSADAAVQGHHLLRLPVPVEAGCGSAHCKQCSALRHCCCCCCRRKLLSALRPLRRWTTLRRCWSGGRRSSCWWTRPTTCGSRCGGGLALVRFCADACSATHSKSAGSQLWTARQCCASE